MRTALHTGGDSLPVGQPLAIKTHVLNVDNVDADVQWREDPTDDGADQVDAEDKHRLILSRDCGPRWM